MSQFIKQLTIESRHNGRIPIRGFFHAFGPREVEHVSDMKNADAYRLDAVFSTVSIIGPGPQREDRVARERENMRHRIVEYAYGEFRDYLYSLEDLIRDGDMIGALYKVDEMRKVMFDVPNQEVYSK